MIKLERWDLNQTVFYLIAFELGNMKGHRCTGRVL